MFPEKREREKNDFDNKIDYKKWNWNVWFVSRKIGKRNLREKKRES